VYFPNGLTTEQHQTVQQVKEIQRGRISEIAAQFGLPYLDNQRPWSIPCDIALPHADFSTVPCPLFSPPPIIVLLAEATGPPWRS
jgi:glutamate dehydrogenase/leucine dehydrogenase